MARNVCSLNKGEDGGRLSWEATSGQVTKRYCACACRHFPDLFYFSLFGSIAKPLSGSRGTRCEEVGFKRWGRSGQGSTERENDQLERVLERDREERRAMGSWNNGEEDESELLRCRSEKWPDLLLQREKTRGRDEDGVRVLFRRSGGIKAQEKMKSHQAHGKKWMCDKRSTALTQSPPPLLFCCYGLAAYGGFWIYFIECHLQQTFFCVHYFIFFYLYFSKFSLSKTFTHVFDEGTCENVIFFFFPPVIDNWLKQQKQQKYAQETDIVTMDVSGHLF